MKMILKKDNGFLYFFKRLTLSSELCHVASDFKNDTLIKDVDEMNWALCESCCLHEWRIFMELV